MLTEKDFWVGVVVGVALVYVYNMVRAKRMGG